MKDKETKQSWIEECAKIEIGAPLSITTKELLFGMLQSLDGEISSRLEMGKSASIELIQFNNIKLAILDHERKMIKNLIINN